MESVEITSTCPKNPNMYEPDRELLLLATPSLLSTNFSLLYSELRLMSYACYCSRNLVQLITWDMNMDNVSSRSLPLKESGREKSLNLVQSKLVSPANRSTPVVVVASVLNVMIFDTTNLRILASTPIDNRSEDGGEPERRIEAKGYRFARGITCVENLIAVGTYTGDIIIFVCTGDTSFTVKAAPVEHKTAIADLATCAFDMITCSADVGGHLVVWSKNMRTVTKRISTGQQISVINILRKQAFCGTYFGQVHVYHTQTGALLAEMNVHARQITSISVATESAYILTASEDGYLRIFKLHSRKPENYQIEYRYAERLDASIVGAQFLTGRGSGFAVATYESKELQIYVIKKSPNHPQ